MILSGRLTALAGLLFCLILFLVACTNQHIPTDSVLPTTNSKGEHSNEARLTPDDIEPRLQSGNNKPVVGTGTVPATSLSPTAEQKEGIDVYIFPTPSDPEMQQKVALAKSDLARQLSILEDQIELIEAIRFDWPDSSLGCPEPGGEYLHVWMVGEVILLRVENQVFEYHSGYNRPPFLCQLTK